MVKLVVLRASAVRCFRPSRATAADGLYVLPSDSERVNVIGELAGVLPVKMAAAKA